MFLFGGETDEKPLVGIGPLGGIGPADCLDADLPNAPPRPNTGRRLGVAFGGGGMLEGGGSSLLISGEPLPSSASSKISLATNDESLSATIPPLFGNSGAEDVFPKDDAGPPLLAPFKGAFPNELEVGPFVCGILPPPPNGPFMSVEPFIGALPNEADFACDGIPPPPNGPF